MTSHLARLILPWLVVALTACTPAPAQTTADGRAGFCGPEDANAVTVIIDFGPLGPEPLIGCASNLSAGARGIDALRALGIQVTEVARQPQFICRLDGYPTPEQTLAIPGQASYVEDCVKTPPSTAYWTYWSADEGGQWAYSLLGYTMHEVIFGGYEGYSFALNLPTGGAKPSIPPQRPA
ncbi:MAG: hypothetical protein LBE83_03365 [Propionibacteriaceae bacterium]|jgi:hypothetical protein|nr:hypothetical protein [Propionibacteriaceae bacterium]